MHSISHFKVTCTLKVDLSLQNKKNLSAGVLHPGLRPPSTTSTWNTTSKGSQGCSEGWSTSHMKTGWGSWACLAWRREDSGETSLQTSSAWEELINRRETVIVIGQGKMVLNQKRGRFRLDNRGKFVIQRLVRHWYCCPEKLWMPHPCRCSRLGWMRPWAVWAGGDRGQPADGKKLELCGL